MRRLLTALALAGLCLAVAIVAARLGSFVAGGSDSYCYVHQAERWASGRLLVPDPLALEAPWPDAALTFAPAGHRPSTTVPGAIVPICPSGLSLVMAAFVVVGGRAAMFLLIPLCGMALVVATFVLGARLHASVGLAAALVIAVSPVFLYQVIQPMSDVPAAAFWTLALAAATSAGPGRRGPLIAGVCAGLAILIRPNLVPLGAVIGVYLLARPDDDWRERLRRAAVYAGGCAVGCLAVAAIQWRFYGSPLASGYGGVGDIFALAHVAPNMARYLSWLVQAHTPVVALALVAPFVLPRPFAALGLAFCAMTLGLYVPYLVFDDWSYVRFLLPAIPMLLVLTLGTVAALARLAGPRWSLPALALTAVVLAAMGVRAAMGTPLAQLQALESVFPRTGDAVARRLPARALVITSRYSGSVRYYAGRETVVWDVLDPRSLDRVVAFARDQGLEPFFLLDSGEEAAFRQRFETSPLARLDWPPQIEIAPQVRLYAPGARDRYLRGEQVATEVRAMIVVRMSGRRPGRTRRAACIAAVALAAVAAACSKPAEVAAPAASVAVMPGLAKAEAGAPIEIEYRFTRVGGAPALPANAWVFVHFVDPAGSVLWTDDHQPPTSPSTWDTTPVTYRRTMFIPRPTPAGRVDVQAGLFSRGDGARVPMIGPAVDGQAPGFDVTPPSNDLLVIYGAGWHGAEGLPQQQANEWRWSMGEARLSFRNPGRNAVVSLEIDQPVTQVGPQAAEIRLGPDLVTTLAIEPGMRRIHRIALSADRLGTAANVDLDLRVRPTFVPAATAGLSSQDTRELGVRVFNAHAGVE